MKNQNYKTDDDLFGLIVLVNVMLAIGFVLFLTECGDQGHGGVDFITTPAPRYNVPHVPCQTTDKKEKKVTKKQIAIGNDLLRTTMIRTTRNRVMLTGTVADSPDREEIISAVRSFNDFNSDNDPHGEHDFGRVTVNGTDYFFKIDYYDLLLECGADPYDENDFIRVLTIMQASEY